MQQDERELVVPVIQEEVHADARPVQTGSVRITKSVETHDELLEQELRRGRAEVVRVKTDRVVDGPQPPQRIDNTLIIPVVSQVLRGCEKAWVVKEEIRVTQIEERETIQHRVPVSTEHARVERLDAAGNVIATEHEAASNVSALENLPPASIAPTVPTRSILKPVNRPAHSKRVLSTPQSILKKHLPRDEQ